MKIIRVFPRRTKATPTDEDVRINCPPGLFDEADEVHVSVAFTWDLPRAEILADQWRHVAPVKIGGPATGERSGEFVSGIYLKRGYVITSRGCPNHCWFCSVPKREGNVRELAITNGWNILDDNLLACSNEHISRVLEMLRRQNMPIQFTGGLEAARLKPWMVNAIKKLRIGQIWFAYDEDADLEPLIQAGKLLHDAGIGLTESGNVSHEMRCYCLVGFSKDTIDAADKRLKAAYSAGFLPMAMLYKNEKNDSTYEWRRFQKWWARPASINRLCRDNGKAKQ